MFKAQTRIIGIVTILFFFFALQAKGQGRQNVKGRVVELETQVSVPGALVKLMQRDSVKLKTSTDDKGYFEFKEIVPGKYTLNVTQTGFSLRTIDILVTSGKEVVLNIELEETISEITEVEVLAYKRGEVNNEMALVSSKSFSVEETERFAGSRGDPARMASNFAGVQGADDSRNDIVVRGNSPLGVIYRVEGVDIPNPNHFAISGSTGGPVSILNNKTMGNSDFFTGAFPAEYGNSISAVFDIKLRPGNSSKHEFTGQFGVLGTELMAEGPIDKERRSSYLAVYRYSTLSIFQAMGLSLGTDAVPKYQDYCFNLKFPTKKGGLWTVFSLGGNSGIDIMISDQKEVSNEFYGDDDRDQYFRTRMAVVGTSYSKTIKENTYLKFTLSANHEQQRAEHDFIIRHVDADSLWVVDSIYPLMRYVYNLNRYSTALSINHKFTKHHIIKFGFNFDFRTYDLLDSALEATHTRFVERWDYTGTGFQFQPYFQYKWKPSDKLAITAGVHSNYFSVSNSLSLIEPRAGLRYQVNAKHTLSLGGGLHSQTQPQYVYFYQLLDSTGKPYLHNKNMDMTRSWHAIAGHDWSIGAAFKIKTEIYYQYLFDIPVETSASAFSLNNMGSGFARFFPDTLMNTGTATNKGIELTIEKFFNQKFFVLFTASVFDAKYKGSDGIERNTDFNGRYAVNVLGGYEFKTGKKTTMSLGSKITSAGGRWYGYVDTAASNYFNELIYKSENYNTRQFRPYFRADLKINFRINGKKVSHEIALDLVNLLNTKNILNLSYAPNPLNPTADPIRENYQLGFLPIFYYKIDF